MRLGLALLARAAGQGSRGKFQQALPAESSDLPFCGNLLWRGDLEFCRAPSWQQRFFDPSYRDEPRSSRSNAFCAAHFALSSLGLSPSVVRPRDNRRSKGPLERKRRVGTTAASILPSDGVLERPGVPSLVPASHTSSPCRKQAISRHESLGHYASSCRVKFRHPSKRRRLHGSGARGNSGPSRGWPNICMQADSQNAGETCKFKPITQRTCASTCPT